MSIIFVFQHIAGLDFEFNVFNVLSLMSLKFVSLETDSQLHSELCGDNNENFNFTLTRPGFKNFCKRRMQNFRRYLMSVQTIVPRNKIHNTDLFLCLCVSF